MTAEEALEIIEQILPPGSLTAAQELVFRRSWLGEEYPAIAREAGYDYSYIRDIGAQLWRSLSKALKEPVKKKNFRALLQQRFNLQPLHLKQAIAPNLTVLSDIPEFPGGAVRLHSQFYIEHPAIQAKAYAEIGKSGSLLRIKASQRMGKSSLLLRIIDQAKTLNYNTVNLDFKQTDSDIFSSLDRFLRWFCIHVSQQLGIEPRLNQYWQKEAGSKASCTLYWTRYLLSQLNAPLLLSFNDFDFILTEHPKLAWEFLMLLQSWHEEARQSNVLQKLRLVIVHSTDIHISPQLSVSSLNMIGYPIELPELNLSQVQTLAQKYGLNWETPNSAQELIDMVGGHPYLLQLALYHLWTGNVTLDQLLQEAPTLTGIYSDHLQSLLVTLQSCLDLSKGLDQIIKDGQTTQVKVAAKLEKLGLIKRQGNLLKLRCKLYHLYFSDHLSLFCLS
ncbi:AAA-like domain-containing protein [Cyanobacteria bacterium FACHB-471]|nr:AAA-like domain-containing protein [Cyanobacteria bacterium FACHB-471]